MTTLAIMQPYFLPYIGYFQLIHSVDTFVVYDNIKYTKKGWINRNRILVNGKASLFTVPLKRASDNLHIHQRELAGNFGEEAGRILRRIEAAYYRAPFYDDAMPIVDACFQGGANNLFDFILGSLALLMYFLEIDTDLVISSSLDIDHELASQDKVLAICKELGASTYVNAIRGQALYNVDDFERMGIDLRFIRSGHIIYEQFYKKLVPNLSIIDILMFNSKERIQEHLSNYSLI